MVDELSGSSISAATAAFDDGVEDGAALRSFDVADKEPVLFAERGGENRIFDEVLIDFNAAVPVPS